MAGSGVSGGGDTTLSILWEDNGFAQDPTDDTHKAPGYDTKLDTAEGTNALQEVFMPSQRVPEDLLTLAFDGAWGLSFILTDPWFFRMLFGSPSQTDNGDGSYTYDYATPEAESFQIVQGYEGAGTERLLKGCVLSQIAIDTTVESGVQVTLSGAYADETTPDTANVTAQPQPDASDALTFVDAALKVGGTSKGYVQNMAMNFQLNVQMIREMGTRVPIDFVDLEAIGDVSLGKLHDDDVTDLQTVYGGAGNNATSPQSDLGSGTTIEMVFDNGDAAGSGINEISATLEGTLPENYDPSGIGDPRSPIEESLRRRGLEMTASATNEVQSAP